MLQIEKKVQAIVRRVMCALQVIRNHICKYWFCQCVSIDYISKVYKGWEFRYVINTECISINLPVRTVEVSTSEIPPLSEVINTSADKCVLYNLFKPCEKQLSVLANCFELVFLIEQVHYTYSTNGLYGLLPTLLVLICKRYDLKFLQKQ